MLVFEEFAAFTENGSSRRPLLPSGNANFTHGYPELRIRSPSDQSARGVVAITVSWPVVYSAAGEFQPYEMSDVAVNTVCLRLGGVGDGRGPGKSQASSPRVNRASIVALAGAAVSLSWLL